MNALLQINALNAGYGDFQALFGVDMHVDAGETVSIIGANGSGKSTVLKTIAGLVTPMSGAVSFDGASLTGVSPHERVARGISLVPEGRRIFPSLSVDENLDIGSYLKRPGPWTKQAVYEAFPLLQKLARRPGGRLSGGEQQTLAIGRALRSNPRLLLLDEVSLGLAPIVVKQVYEAVPMIRSHGTTVVIVEQDVSQALAVADRVYCLLEGRVSLQGVADQLDRERVTEAYFGIGVPTGEHQ
jgi:branched-chain amino acid transport system ATP-binding protein